MFNFIFFIVFHIIWFLIGMVLIKIFNVLYFISCDFIIKHGNDAVNATLNKILSKGF